MKVIYILKFLIVRIQFVDKQVTPQTLEIKYKRCGTENSASIFDNKKREIFYSHRCS